MHGYETKQQRDAHIKALAQELSDVKGSIAIAKEKLSEVPEDGKVERAAREVDLEALEGRVEQIQEQLRTFKGAAPHKRAQTRKQDATEKR